jgi:hypothetical protein
MSIRSVVGVRPDPLLDAQEAWLVRQHELHPPTRRIANRRTGIWGVPPAEGRDVHGRLQPSYRVRLTDRNNAMLDGGRHPMTLHPLRQPAGERCGTCSSLRHVDGGVRAYYKCGLIEHTAGPATDVRRKWAACELWTHAGVTSPRLCAWAQRHDAVVTGSSSGKGATSGAGGSVK